jgi:hypothetical protein
VSEAIPQVLGEPLELDGREGEEDLLQIVGHLPRTLEMVVNAAGEGTTQSELDLTVLEALRQLGLDDFELARGK